MKITKKELQQEINILQSKNITNRNLIFRINRALASINIDIMDDEFDVEPEPKLKQLDQSVFDGLDEKWRFAVVDANGRALKLTGELEFRGGLYQNKDKSEHIEMKVIGTGYDTSNWQNSLIERDIAKELLEVDLSSELTGSDLTEQIMKSQKYQPAFVSDESEQDALNSQRTALIDNVYMSDRDYRFRAELNGHRYAVPINNQGEPLTAADAGL